MKRYELTELLYENIHIIKPYPYMVKPVEKIIDITAFFLGGKGLWLEEHSEKFTSILVIGQDFSTIEEYKKC